MDLDATDRGILRCLQEDARSSLRTIAKKVGVSVPTVSARLRNLEAIGIVRGYRVVLDPERLDETVMALVVRTRARATRDVADSIARTSWARRVLTGRPGWILVDATALRHDRVHAIRREITSIPGVVRIQEYGSLQTVKDESAAILTDRLTTTLACFECKGPIHGEPVRARRDGRYHYFCCTTCRRLYLERYARIRSASRVL